MAGEYLIGKDMADLCAAIIRARSNACFEGRAACGESLSKAGFGGTDNEGREMLKIEQPWGDHRLKMNGVFIGCVTKENADIIMRLQRLAVVIEADQTQPVFRREANATPLEFRDELLRLAIKAHN